MLGSQSAISGNSISKNIAKASTNTNGNAPRIISEREISGATPLIT
jgi:hypothetical protein